MQLPNGQPLQLMSVHLKSGCHQGSLVPATRPACATLALQRFPLELWVDDLTLAGTPFVLLGDFNRRIEVHGQDDHLWGEIDDGEPALLDLFRLPFVTTSPCLSGTPGHHPQPIDYLVFDEQAWDWVDAESFRIMDYTELPRLCGRKWLIWLYFGHGGGLALPTRAASGRQRDVEELEGAGLQGRGA